MNALVDEIIQLKEEKNAVILAHYYVPDEVQEIADYIGDSYYLSKVATTVERDVIVFCGVSFMGESAKLLNPEKTVLMPDADADCAMAHMADPKKIEQVKKEHPDAAVVCYINSTTELKTYSDVCVTSSNAEKTVRALPNETIYFIPDEHLGRYVAAKVPEKKFIFNAGYCPIHNDITRDAVLAAKEAHPNAAVLVHPECPKEIVELADYAGSTSGIIAYATESEKKEFIIGTEDGVFYELKKKNPDKTFYPVHAGQCCPGMKLVTLEKVRDALKYGIHEVHISEKMREKACRPLDRMLELAR
ncbi:MAG TPA: quinolinate synthase [Lachnospiraceae bacterium]|nr:quinolinate synthase [Lachnospiraceae bacterium]